MSLLLAYTFNDNSTSPADFSGNKNTGASNNVTLVAGQNYGYAAHIGQTSLNSYISCTPAGFAGLTAFTAFTSLNLVSFPVGAAKAYLFNKTSSFNAYITSAEKVVFTIYISGAAKTITSTSTLSGTGWHTIGCVYDGANIYIYIDGVQDASTLSVTGTIATGIPTLLIGNDVIGDSSNTLVADMDSILFANTAASSNDMLSLNASPDGLLITNSSNNFATGDLIDDGTQTYQGVVTWVVSVDSFYFYPTTAIGTSYVRLGNIYQTKRQYYYEFINNFDGQGNGQTKISWPIAGFKDYGATAHQITIDYRGIVNSTHDFPSPYVFFSETQIRYSALTQTTFYNEKIKASSISVNGSYITFSYHVKTANNANAKTLNIKIGPNGAELNLLTYSLPVSTANDIFVTGAVKVTNILSKTCNYRTKIESNGVAPIIADGTITLDFTKDIYLLLQGTGVAVNDITAIDGEGIINPNKQLLT